MPSSTWSISAFQRASSKRVVASYEPDEVYDFSDLELPDGSLEQQDLEGNLGDQAEKIADAVGLSSSSSQ